MISPEDSQDLMKQLGLAGPPNPSYSDLLAASAPPVDSSATPVTEGTESLPAGPVHPDEMLADPTMAHRAAPVTEAKTESSIPLVSAPAAEPAVSDPEERPFNIPSPMPKRGLIMQNAENEVAGNQAELERMRSTGSGVSQVKNPFLRALARIGDIAGTIFAPEVTTLVPGSTLHHGYLERLKQNDVDKGMDDIRTLTGADKDEAQAEHERADAKGNGDVGKTPAELLMHDLMAGDNGNPRVNPDTKQPYTYTEAYQKIKGIDSENKPVKEDDKLMSQTTFPAVQANKALESRFQVMHPGQPLPPEMTLGDKATVGDYKRVDEQLTKYINAEGTQAQRDQANAMRQDALSQTAQREQDKLTKEGEDMVQGFEPGTNRTVLASRAEAAKMGLEDVMKAPTADSSKSLAARHFLPLVYRNNSADPGILQIIRKLDRAGKLGIVASRWNDFMAGKVGGDSTDQQMFERLRVKLGLSKTLLMNLHVGNRGGAYMFEHFEELANEKRMDAKTLRAGVEEEFKYALDRAMLPANRMKEYKAFTGENSLGANTETTKAETPKPEVKKTTEASVKPISGAYTPKEGDPAIGSVENGYRYKGGDPKNQDSWEPVVKGTK